MSLTSCGGDEDRQLLRAVTGGGLISYGPDRIDRLLGAAADEQSRRGMQITVLMSFKRNGELFGQPRITFQSSDASDAERASYRTAVVETLKRCASLPFTEAFGNGMAGEPFSMRFVDDRERPPN